MNALIRTAALIAGRATGLPLTPAVVPIGGVGMGGNGGSGVAAAASAGALGRGGLIGGGVDDDDDDEDHSGALGAMAKDMPPNVVICGVTPGHERCVVAVELRACILRSRGVVVGMLRLLERPHNCRDECCVPRCLLSLPLPALSLSLVCVWIVLF
jgi:hypothetical protein